MIQYEVRLEVKAEVAKEFEVWLDEHIGRVLKAPGFLHANCYETWPTEKENQGTRKWLVQYHLKDSAAMERYLEEFAPALRQEGLDRFGDAMQASRRILQCRKKFSP